MGRLDREDEIVVTISMTWNQNNNDPSQFKIILSNERSKNHDDPDRWSFALFSPKTDAHFHSIN